MPEQNNIFQQARSYSIQYGLYVSLYWIASFLCLMYAMKFPFLSIVSQIAAFMSLFAAIKYVSEYCSRIQPLNFLQKILFSLNICTFASLITTIVQYFYFRYIDKGAIFHTMAESLSDPSFKELFEKQMPGFAIEDILEILSKTTYLEFAIQFLIANTFIAFIFTLIMALFSRNKNNQHT